MYYNTENRLVFFDICSEEFCKPIRVNIVSQDIKTGPPLSPILILNRLDMLEFCRLGKELDDFLKAGTMLPVVIFKNYFQDFSLDFKSISFADLYDWIVFCYIRKKQYVFLKKKLKKNSFFFFFFDLKNFYWIFFFKYLLNFENVFLTSVRFFFQSYLGTLKCRPKAFIWYVNIGFLLYFYGKKFNNNKQIRPSKNKKQRFLYLALQKEKISSKKTKKLRTK